MIKSDIKNEAADICTKCRSPIVYNDLKGILVCTNCGEIKEDRIVCLTSEYRYFNDDTSGRSDPRRAGNPVNMHMDSQIDLVEISDNFTHGKKHYSTFAGQSNADKNYIRAVKLIKKYCDLLQIPFLQKTAEEIYFEVRDKEEIKGKRLEATIAAIIFLAGRQRHIYVGLQSFENIVDSPVRTLMKACNVICKLIPRIVVKASDLVKKYCHNFGVPHCDRDKLVKLCEAIDEFNVFDGKRPKDGSIAAAVFYYYTRCNTNINLQMSHIKEVTGVSSDGLIKQYAEVLEKKNLWELAGKNQIHGSHSSRNF